MIRRLRLLTLFAVLVLLAHGAGAGDLTLRYDQPAPDTAEGWERRALPIGNGEIHLLPALPRAWSTGSVRGLRARGGFEVDMRWANGTLSSATLRHVGKDVENENGAGAGAAGGHECRLRYGGKRIELRIPRGASRTVSSF